MGSQDFYPEEQPVREVAVDAYWIDANPVTVAEFRRFVKATGYVTRAEQPLDPADYPEASPAVLVPGSLVFQPTRGPVPLDDYTAWSHYVPGASWERPEGSESNVYTRGLHPVVHVADEDAAAYAGWAGKELPTEAQCEYAPRGGLDEKIFCWGDEFMPGGRLMANTWHGEFPFRHNRPDEWLRTSPVGSYPRTATGSTTWPATSGSGRLTSTRPTARPSPPAVRRATRIRLNPSRRATTPRSRVRTSRAA